MKTNKANARKRMKMIRWNNFILHRLVFKNIKVKKFTFLQLLNIIDGRLFTKMDDIYQMLGFYCGDEGITTLGLVFVFDQLKEDKPKWFTDLQARWQEIKDERGWNDLPKEKFLDMRAIIEASYNNEYEMYPRTA